MSRRRPHQGAVGVLAVRILIGRQLLGVTVGVRGGHLRPVMDVASPQEHDFSVVSEPVAFAA